MLDFVLRNGVIVDGTGLTTFFGDVGVGMEKLKVWAKLRTVVLRN
nr:hypothetical protein [Alicyclobacillus tolerans]